MVYFTVKCNFRTVFPVTATNLVCAPSRLDPAQDQLHTLAPVCGGTALSVEYCLDEAIFNIDINKDTQYPKKAPTNTLLTCVC